MATKPSSTVPLLVLVVLLLSATSASAARRAKVNGNQDTEKFLAYLYDAGNFKTFIRLFRSSGFAPIVSRYVESQPVTMLIPTDLAFSRLPLRIRMQLSGPKLIQLLEYHMLMHKISYGFLKFALPGGQFSTLYGVDVVKQPAALPDTVVLAPLGVEATEQMAIVTKGDICEGQITLLSCHQVNNVLIPPKVFDTASI